MSLYRTVVMATKETPIYTAYRCVVDRKRMLARERALANWSDEDERRLAFYRQFISSHDLVFDVGANVGNRSKVFRKLGATVVAVEPLEHGGDVLEAAFRGDAHFHLVRKALGACVRDVELQMNYDHTISSLSEGWMRAVKGSGRFAGYKWNRSQKVMMDTLDNLMAEFGKPAFVKIDVEGYEDQVLRGLSCALPMLSLEYTPEYEEGIRSCIDQLSAMGTYEFQLSVGESMKFHLPGWVDAEDVMKAFASVPANVCGDLYARLCGAAS